MVTCVVAAVAAAVCFALASVTQHHAASTTPPAGRLRLAARIATSRLWLLGVLTGAVGFAAQAVALATGPLVLVQLVLVSGLAAALPAALVLEGRRARRAEWVWAACTLAGLAVFLLAGRPSPGLPVAATGTLAGAGVVCLGLVAALTLTARVVSRAVAPRFAALALGLGGGVAFGLAGALGKQVVDLVQIEGASGAATWELWGLFAAALTGVASTQASYRAGALAASQPAITVAEPLTAAVVGALAFEEHLADGPVAVAGQVVAALVMLTSVIGLAHCAQPSDPSPAARSTSRPTPPTPTTRDHVATTKE